MSQCLRITFVVEDSVKSALAQAIQKEARKLNIEGLVHVEDSDKLRIIACGLKEKIERFLDLLYKQVALQSCDDVEVEPFFKDKDYRGVFRIIE